MRSFLKLLPMLVLPGLSYAQTGLVCTASSVPPIVRAEGLAERLGDMLLNCSGGQANGVVTGNLAIILSTNLTNRLNSLNNLDIILTTDNGTGPFAANVPARLTGPNQATYEGLSFQLSPTGATTVRISNVRGSAASAGVSGFLAPITARLAFNAGQLVSFFSNTFNVGIPNVSTLGTILSTLRCSQAGSPLPDNPNMATLIQTGTAMVSARVTEGFASAFTPRDPLADTGTRIISRYVGFPAGSRLFVPDVIAGSDSLKPTSAGDFGVTASVGDYVPTATGSLILVRVFNTDSNGAGGAIPSSGSFGAVSEVPLVGGSGVAVYEVLDASPNVRESFQIISWLGLAPQSVSQTITTSQEIMPAPVSTVNTATSTAPIPRFAAGTLPPDCQLLGDCNASYLPRLGVDSPLLEFSAVSGSAFQVRYVRVFNDGGGVLRWNASLTSKNGTGWAKIDPPAGAGNATVRLDVTPGSLAAGVYEATLNVDAGAAGNRSVPIKLTISARPDTPSTNPATSPVAVSSVTNAATFLGGPLVRGSLATVKGTRFDGANVNVTFDALPARVLFSNSDQINLQVPSDLTNRASAQVVVNVDGVAAPPKTVALTDFAPGIFVPGILNQDNSVNGISNGAPSGSVVQVYATGVMEPGSSGNSIQVKIHDRYVTPVYAGPAPGYSGVQQINFLVPDDLPAMTSELRICSTKGGEQMCSPAVNIVIR